MPRRTIRTLSGPFFAALVIAACSSSSSSGTTGGADAGRDAGASDGGYSAEGGLTCPFAEPMNGDPCTFEGLGPCSYGDNPGCDGYWVCQGGGWQHQFPGVPCVMMDAGSGGLDAGEADAGASDAAAD